MFFIWMAPKYTLTSSRGEDIKVCFTLDSGMVVFEVVISIRILETAKSF